MAKLSGQYAEKFKELEIGCKLGRREFESVELTLRHALLEAQFALAEADYPVIIIIGGLEGAGKGSVIHRLNEWMDPRGIETEGFWQHSDEEESRPYFWRFWRKLPPRGHIGLYIGAWYNRPGYALIEGDLPKKELAARCREISYFEQMHTAGGALIIKLWLQVGAGYQKMQLAEEAPRKLQNPRIPVLLDHDKISYKAQMKAAIRILEQTDTAACPWHLIDAEDHYHRDVTAGRIILDQLQRRAGMQHSPVGPGTSEEEFDPALPPTVSTPLESVDLSQALEKDDYRKQLDKYQSRLQDLAWRAHPRGGSLVAVFEGWDAAGKGSAIRRVTGAIDPRLYRVLQYAAPTDEERAHHYLWRFWRRLGRDGSATLFDRSWYGRVLVERIENLATENEWQRAYAEINEFERQLVDHGSTVLKFWIHISPEVQLQRFREREREPYKSHKITDEDWRNREKWPQYEQAVNEMIARTSTEHAPWTLVAGNDKRHARIQIIKTFCAALAD